MHYTAISIIYNPISTGPSKTYALRLRKKLRRSFPDSSELINVVLTEYAGHAEALAYELSKASKHPLVIASGGDGSYHEVVNGAMRAYEEGAKPVCGLLPGGNANDHYRNVHSAPIGAMIASGEVYSIDLLRIETSDGHKAWQRYAHSYCGFGLTAEAGHELNKIRLNPAKEVWTVLKTLKDLQAIPVIIDGETAAYSTLVCSNVSKMSKILKLSAAAKVHDGTFEITAVSGHSKAKLIGSLLQATATGFSEVRQAKTFAFTTIEPLRLQIDGEIYKIAANTEVKITVAPQILRCII